ncbi:hypothetical protein Kpol_1062p9 [Vanderwaltozyma polyspora DSM 70294]|uniref:Mitochondrial ornithine carrier protein n=1 Tax=Vanderwaltozyma polyspora (strain ATCC 22028 / DSM 70294 / BCRC 21397 / CBS 2163 / NBRC 10782 / NRRL Y-8283 / UCD 57-17) TaxID=436907 RepID=A7TK67_VANPO|nr:uncharacterized protein Kpol_1062p9 [Vanderwaltozyma polyspora DSM 70294]EDO17302.1 hypothetical protein Kpol_1062p9 [Vanderwaltozyma polyspora DSM 70294]
MNDDNSFNDIEIKKNTSALKDIINGSIAGCFGKIIEYPFDTIKVRLQTQGSHLFPTTWSCIKYTFKNEGIKKGFFQGISSPLVGAAMENAVLFLSYNQCAKMLDNQTYIPEVTPLTKIIISGAFAGSCASFVLTPVELVKCKLQIANIQNNSSSLLKPTRILPTIKNTLTQNGVFGLWQGQSGTFIRESIGGVAWFATYELMKDFLKYQRHDKENKTWELLLSGASAGLAFNATIFPVDTVKSVMQTEHLGLKSSISLVLKRQGFAGFYRGLAITLIRAAPANATVFYTYETLSSM